MADETGALEAEGTAEVIGKGAEQIGEFFIPVGGQAKVAAKLSKIPALAKDSSLLANIVKTLSKSATTATEFGGKTLAQTGDIEQAKEVGAISMVLPIAGKALKVGGEKLAESAISLSAKEAKVVQAYKATTPFWERVFVGSKAPVTVGKTAFKKGIAGTESSIGVQATKAKNNLWKKIISPQLKGSDVKVNIQDLFKETEKSIIKNNPELSRQKSLLHALDSMKEDYAKVGDVSIAELQKLKEGWAKFLPDKVYKGKPIAGAFNDMKSILSGISRSTIHKNISKEARQAYYDYGNLISLQELGQKSMTGGKMKGGFGGFWSAIKDTAITPVSTIGGKVVYKVGEGIEMIGKQGSKTLNDLFN
jgi:hypothetical protein